MKRSKIDGRPSLAAVLLAAALLGGCGAAADPASTSSPAAAPTRGASHSAVAAPSPDAAVEQAAQGYLTGRAQALVPGSAEALSVCLLPGSPAAAAEPFVAAGRILLFAECGVEVVAVASIADTAAAPPAFYHGSEPVTAASLTLQEPGLVRAIVFATVTSGLTLSDGRLLEEASEHVLTLILIRGKWRVFRDRYLDARQAAWLAAGGASGRQVAAARARRTAYQRSRRVAAIPEGAVREFVRLLGAGRYTDADLYLAFAFHGTAEGMGSTLRSVRLLTLHTKGKPSDGKATVVAGLQVEPRLSLWNDGLNVRFFSLERGAYGAWRIVGISSGP